MYASTREEELAVTGWPDDIRSAFLRSQFDAQDQHYRGAYAGARFDVVLVDGEPAGRLYVSRTAEGIRVVDIALLPQYRRRGVGSAILRALLNEGQAGQLPVTIHVEQQNPARHLYQRLGFEARETHGLYVLMEWRPGPPA